MYSFKQIRNAYREYDELFGLNTQTITFERFVSYRDVIKLVCAENNRVVTVKFNELFLKNNISMELFRNIVKHSYACVANKKINNSTSKNTSEWRIICSKLCVSDKLTNDEQVKKVLNEYRLSQVERVIICPKCGCKEEFTRSSQRIDYFDAGGNITCKKCGWIFKSSDAKVPKATKNAYKPSKGDSVIDRFSDEYFFLSNFYYSDITYEGIKYSSVEAAFQATKTLDIDKRQEFSFLTPSQAKSKGRHITLRQDWEEIKYNVMRELVFLKFSTNKTLRSQLLSTGNAELIEGNTWNDKYWGVCNGEGENCLGKILMEVRDLLL